MNSRSDLSILLDWEHRIQREIEDKEQSLTSTDDLHLLAHTAGNCLFVLTMKVSSKGGRVIGVFRGAWKWGIRYSSIGVHVWVFGLFSWVCLFKQDGLPQKTGHFSKESSLDCGFLIQGNHNLIGFLFVEGRKFYHSRPWKQKKGMERGHWLFLNCFKLRSVIIWRGYFNVHWRG